VELFVRKNTTKIKISASQCISIKNCINYDHNKKFGLLKFQSGYRKLYLNSPKGYSQKIINTQTGYNYIVINTVNQGKVTTDLYCKSGEGNNWLIL